MSQLDEQIEAAFPLVAFITNRHLMNHLHRISTHLQMDLDTTYIWGTLAHLNLAPAFGGVKHISEIYNPDGTINASLKPVSLSNLSQVTGFPRETVRRKLEYLKSLQRANRQENGDWIIEENSVTPDIFEFTKETVNLLLETANQVQKVLAAHQK
jgi:hypothetical protein